MNANELADKAESVQTWEYGTTDEWIEQAATMLRQQQEEIEKLRMTQPNIDYDKELLKPTFVGRELTDEEIMEVANEIFSKYKNWHHYQLDFARAILRKTQEK